MAAITTSALSRFEQARHDPSTSTDDTTSSRVAGPAEGLFCAASALSLAVRARDRWVQVKVVQSMITARRLGGEESREGADEESADVAAADMLVVRVKK